MRLFTIAQEFTMLQNMIEDIEVDENGEFIDNSEVIASLFDEINESLAFKLDNSAYVVKELESSAAALKEEATRLNNRAKMLLNNSDRLQSLMKLALEKSGEDKLKTDKFTFSFRNSEKCIMDEQCDPNDFDRRWIKVSRSFDIAKIKKALKNNEVIDGASIVKNKNFSIK